MRKQLSRYRYDKCHVFIDSRVRHFRALPVCRTVSLRRFIFTYIKCHVADILRYVSISHRAQARFYIRALIFDFSELTRAGRVVRNDRSTRDKKEILSGGMPAR